MVAIQIEYCRLEQRSVIKFLVTKKCNLCEIYRMRDVYEEVCASQKIFTNDLNNGFYITILSQKDSQWS